MNINELFEKLQDKFLPEEINGEFTLNGNCIIWEFTLDCSTHSDETTIPVFNDDEEYEIIYEYSTPEEQLLDEYNKIFEQIELFLDELDELDVWTISDSDILENSISFKIF